MTGLDKITAKIIDDAKINAEKVLKNAEDECKKIKNDYLKRSETLKDNMLNEAETELSSLISRAKASAAIERQNAVLAEKSILVDEAFALAYNNILDLSEDDYFQLMTDILSSILLNQAHAEEAEIRDYGGDELEKTDKYYVLLNKKDREAFGQKLIEAARIKISGKGASSTAEKLCLSDKTVAIDGGIVLAYGDVTVNCSLSMIFKRLRETAETDVYQILFKEKE